MLSLCVDVRVCADWLNSRVFGVGVKVQGFRDAPESETFVKSQLQLYILLSIKSWCSGQEMSPLHVILMLRYCLNGSKQ